MIIVSLFPGLGFFDRAFEEEGFTVVRGPDVIWGGDVRSFRLPAGVFAGVIGGPPCQPFSPLVHMVRHNGCEPRHANLIPEFERLVSEAQPRWFVMEESPFAPLPSVPGYRVHDQIVNNRWLGEAQNRTRRISFGTPDGRRLPIEFAALETVEWFPAVTSKAYEVPIRHLSGGRARRASRRGSDSGSGLGWVDGSKRLSIEEMLRRQGYPPDLLDECPLTVDGKRQAVGNAVPHAMGRAIAKAVRAALSRDAETAA